MNVPVPCPDHYFYVVAFPTYLEDGPDRESGEIVYSAWSRQEAEEEIEARYSAWNPDRGPRSFCLEIAVATMV